MSKKALLMILDGWGIGDQGKDDVISIHLLRTGTVCWQHILTHSFRQAVKM